MADIDLSNDVKALAKDVTAKHLVTNADKLAKLSFKVLWVDDFKNAISPDFPLVDLGARSANKRTRKTRSES